MGFAKTEINCSCKFTELVNKFSGLRAKLELNSGARLMRKVRVRSNNMLRLGCEGLGGNGWAFLLLSVFQMSL